MDLTTQPTPPAPPIDQPLVEYVRTQRSTAAYILLGLSAACLAVTIWAAVKGFKPRAVPAADRPVDTKTFDPENPTPPTPEVADPNRGDYIVGGLGGLIGFLVTAGVGVWLLVGLPNPSVERQRTEARMALLAVGGILGITLMVLGGLYFYRWSEALTGWLDKGEAKQARWVLIPLLMVVGGAALVFTSTQAARAEERNDPVIRRLVYGANFGLAALLLFLVLIAVNVFISLRVPNKLDTTESGFYSLSPSTEEFLAKLDQPVTAYGILPESGARDVDDIRRLLTSFQDSPASRFKVRFISPTLNKSELRSLASRYPQVELNETGVLLTAGEDEKRNSFIREDEFMDRGAPGRGAAGRSFVGESRLVREIAFLAENKQKAVVYFTQSAGELSIVSGVEETSPADSGTQLKAFLEKSNLDVRPLKFDPASAKVPDDASVVVVAEPRSPLTEAAVGAIRKFMVEPRPGGGKGKLIVLAGARFGPDGKVVKTGLEQLLAEFKIQVMDRLILSEDTRELDPEQAAVGFTRAAVTAKNPVAITLGEKVIFLASDWRPVSAITAAPEVPGAPAMKAVSLLITYPGRANWLEEERPTDMNKIVRELNTLPAVRFAKQLTESPRAVAAVASEGDSGRVAVFGNGRWVSDSAVRQSRSGSAPVTFDLISGTIDWLRDRPVVGQGIEAKKYKEYTFPAAVDETRILWFPLGLAFALIAGLGAGVWVIRRK